MTRPYWLDGAGYLIVLFAAMGLDIWSGTQIPLWILYVVPIGLAAWNIGGRAGFILVAVSLVLSLVYRAELFNSGPPKVYFVIGSRTIALAMIVWLTSRLRAKEITRLYAPVPGNERSSGG